MQFVVSTIRPAPSRLELLSAIRGKSIDGRRDGKPLAAAWYAEHPELLPGGAKGVPFNYPIQGTMTHIEEDRRTLPLIEEFDRGLAAQQELVSSLRFLSPAVLTYEALQDVSGSGVARARLFRQQVRSFRQDWLAWFHPRIFRMTVLRSSEYTAIPQFSFREEAAGDWVLRTAPGALALLSVSCVLSLLAARKLH
jgi:ABC-2 type transport system permease protein